MRSWSAVMQPVRSYARALALAQGDIVLSAHADSDSLRSHIHQLRQAIDKPFASPLLHTQHGLGYRLLEKPNAV